MRAPLVLVTDFGHLDPYVGQMKGVLLRYNPEAVIVDLCHEITPHAVLQAAFMLRASRAHFPDRSIFLCVVDPGVGTSRPTLLAREGTQLFLAPDNGLLSFLPIASTSWWRLPPPCPDASRTFHGRDLFAPLAARLTLGARPDELGTPITAADIVLQENATARTEPNRIRCRVVHADRFGNCLLDLPIQDYPDFRLHPSGILVRSVRLYAELAPGEIGLLAGSQGVMELAMNQNHCARFLNLSPGHSVDLIRAVGTRP